MLYKMLQWDFRNSGFLRKRGGGERHAHPKKKCSKAKHRGYSLVGVILVSSSMHKRQKPPTQVLLCSLGHRGGFPLVWSRILIVRRDVQQAVSSCVKRMQPDQNFITQFLVSALSELRKYRISITLANQFLDQVNKDIRDAVLGNVGTRAVVVMTSVSSAVYNSIECLFLITFQKVIINREYIIGGDYE